MKLEQILVEGMRFTNKEINTVKKNQRNILVAYEFEFTPDVNAINNYRSKIHDTGKKDDEPIPPRQRLTWDDLTMGNFEEYDELYNEEERDYVEEQVEQQKNDWETDKEEELRSDHQGFLDNLDNLTGLVLSDRNKYSVRKFNPISKNRLDDLDRAIDNINQEVAGDNDYTEVAIMLTRLNDYHTYLNDVFPHFNSELTGGVDEFYNEFRSNYSTGGLDKFVTNLYHNEHNIRMFVEDFEDFDLVHDFSDFNHEQRNLLLDTTKLSIEEAIDEYESLDIDYDGMDSFNDAFLVIIEDAQGIDDDVSNMIQSNVDAGWNSQKQAIEEEIYESGYFEFSSEGMMQAIADIQDNHHVAFYHYEDVDDEDAAPIVPFDGSQHNAGTGIGSGADNRQLVKNFIQEYGQDFNLNFSRDFEAQIDVEGHRMIEIKSNPVPLMDALRLMKSMFAFIKKFGDVSHGHAGLHTNMSIKGKTFGKTSFNKSKLLLLVDDQLLREMFPVRSHVAKTVRNIDIRDTFRIAKLHVNRSRSVLGDDFLTYSEAFENFFSDSTKSQGINFQHMKVDDIGKRRIEFRAIGGKDYVDRYNTIEWWVYRFAYIMEAAFDDNFLKKEYLKELVTILDKPVKNDPKIIVDSFSELVSIIHTKHFTDYDDLVTYSSEQKFK